MTIMRTGTIAALGLLALSWAAPASAGATVATASIDGPGAAGLHQVTDRGSWVEPRTRWRGEHRFGLDRRYDRHDGYDRKRHYKKKRRKVFKRGFNRGYDRGYDQGYYEGRRHSRFERRFRRDPYYYQPRSRFRGGFFFGDGYRGGGNFRFRY